MQQPGILQPAEADSQSIGRRRFTETAHYMYCWTLLPAIVPDGGPVDLEIEKKVKQLDCCLSLPFDSPSAAPPRRPCQSHVPPRAAAAPVAKLRDTGRGDTNG
jgi:hypothetical protein